MKRFFQDLYYDIKSYFWSLTTYHKVVKKMKPWDGCYLYEMTKFQLEILLPIIENGNEVEEYRMEKVKDIKRLIQLLNNNIEDNYSDRCGFDHNYELIFEKMDNGNYEVKSNETSEQDSNNRRALEDAFKLEQKELKEIGELYSKVTQWWD